MASFNIDFITNLIPTDTISFVGALVIAGAITYFIGKVLWEIVHSRFPKW